MLLPPTMILSPENVVLLYVNQPPMKFFAVAVVLGMTIVDVFEFIVRLVVAVASQTFPVLVAVQMPDPMVRVRVDAPVILTAGTVTLKLFASSVPLVKVDVADELKLSCKAKLPPIIAMVSGLVHVCPALVKVKAPLPPIVIAVVPELVIPETRVTDP